MLMTLKQLCIHQSIEFVILILHHDVEDAVDLRADVGLGEVKCKAIILLNLFARLVKPSLLHLLLEELEMEFQ
jgi:hypothetical protein